MAIILLFKPYNNENTKKLRKKTTTSIFANKSSICITIEKKMDQVLFIPHVSIKYFKLGSVHDGYSELRNLGILLKGRCEPKLYNFYR